MNLETLEDGVRWVENMEIPQTVKNTVMKMLEGNKVEKSFCQDRLQDKYEKFLNSPNLICLNSYRVEIVRLKTRLDFCFSVVFVLHQLHRMFQPSFL